jgi:hypothetical protein
MRHLTIRMLVLLLLAGFLIFAPMQKSKVKADGACTQACYNMYSACLGGGQGDFFYCCAAYNECLQENCGTGPKCHLPEQYP